MNLRVLFTFTFVYASLLYTVTQYGEIQTGKTKSWCIVDAIVIVVFLKNAAVSFFFWNSESVQNFAALANVAMLLWFVLPQTGLGKRFTMQFTFMNFTLMPLVFVFLYGGETPECATRVLGLGLAASLPAWFLTTTANADVQETSHVSARINALAALVVQVMTTLPAVAQCDGGTFFMKPVVWLTLLRFFTCGLLGYSVTVERIDMQPSSVIKC